MFDRDRKLRTSAALWIPVLWILLVTSKPISAWLQLAPNPSIDQNLEGNPLERTIFTALVGIGLIVLITRRRRVVALLRLNGPVLLFFGYCAVSTLWSDYPDVAFKRWIKALGDLVMVTIVLTDPIQSTAVKRFLAWTGFLLVPTSVLLIKYYPDLGMTYKHAWEEHVGVGVANDKNMLGVICLLFGLAAVWRLLHAIHARKSARSNRPLIAQEAMLAMSLWLFLKADSMTSFASFVIGSCLIVMTGLPAMVRHRALVHALVASVLAVASLVLLGGGAGLVRTVGRDPTLTGRTEIWKECLSAAGSPLVGTGFESFWLGPRLDKIVSQHVRPNEAHNGYIEVFLNLGWMGVALLALVIVTGYRNAIGMLRWDPDAGKIKLAYFVVGVIYSFTEAGFRMMNPVWIFFMLGTIVVPLSPLPRTYGTRDSLGEAVVPESRMLEA